MKFNPFNTPLVIYTTVIVSLHLVFRWCGFFSDVFFNSDAQVLEYCVCFIGFNLIFFEIALLKESLSGFLLAFMLTNIIIFFLILLNEPDKILIWLVAPNILILVRLVKNLMKNNFSIKKEDLLTRC